VSPDAGCASADAQITSGAAVKRSAAAREMREERPSEENIGDLSSTARRPNLSLAGTP
jgi:hypothetical protein